jgi:hypothetical protein
VFNARSAVLGVAAIGAVIALTGCSDKTHGDTSTLKLTEPGGNTGTFGPIGNATQSGTPPGTGFAFSSPLQDSSHKDVGELDVTCIATQASPGQGLNGQCTGTATVPGGTLAIDAGGKNVGPNVSGSITGGTGKYAGATGTFTSQQPTTKGNAPSNDTFNITLP